MTLAWARGKGREEQPDPNPPVWPVLAELEVYTDTRRLIGWIAPEGERTSDWINRANELELIAAVETALDAERPQLTQPAAGAGRTRVPASEVLFAVPPSLPQGRHLRLHRRVQRVRFQLEGYQLSGKIHVRPGAEVGDYLLRSSRVFVPITDAELVHQREPQFIRLLPVVIMNARYVSRIHLFDGSSEPMVGAPETPFVAETPSLAEGAAQVSVPAQPSSPPPTPNLAAGPILPTGDPAAVPLPPPPAMPAEQPPSFRMSDIEPAEGSVHRALSELAAMHRDGLVTDAEFEAKRSEILSRL
jgi:hypothetical protein